MVNKITNIIKNKYYRYQPGEFLPVYSGGELINKRQFHVYKFKRAVAITKYYFKTVHYNFKQLQQQ